MHKQGIISEQYFEEFCKSNDLDYKKVHRPFDFIVNNNYVEVKSTQLVVKQSHNRYGQGRFECWNKSQHKLLLKKNVWICLIITFKDECMIYGFIKSKYLINGERRFSINKLRKNLISVKRFLYIIKKPKVYK